MAQHAPYPSYAPTHIHHIRRHLVRHVPDELRSSLTGFTLFRIHDELRSSFMPAVCTHTRLLVNASTRLGSAPARCGGGTETPVTGRIYPLHRYSAHGRLRMRMDSTGGLLRYVLLGHCPTAPVLRCAGFSNVRPTKMFKAGCVTLARRHSDGYGWHCCTALVESPMACSRAAISRSL